MDDEVQNFAINEAERKHDFKKLRQKPNSVAELDVAPSEKKDWKKWYEKPEFSEDTGGGMEMNWQLQYVIGFVMLSMMDPRHV